jgi:hypothetical protein
VIPSVSLTCTETQIGLHAVCLLLLPHRDENWNISTNFSKLLNIKFHKSRYSHSPTVRGTEVATLLSFRRYATTPKISSKETILSPPQASISSRMQLFVTNKRKAVPLHAMEALGERGV